MSYDISFKVKVEGADRYVGIGGCANITWNARKIIEKSTGLPWINCANNGLCKDIIPEIQNGLKELQRNGYKYLEYESPNGWGTVGGTIKFFKQILKDWDELIRDDEELAELAYFWIE